MIEQPEEILNTLKGPPTAYRITPAKCETCGRGWIAVSAGIYAHYTYATLTEDGSVQGIHGEDTSGLSSSHILMALCNGPLKRKCAAYQRVKVEPIWRTDG